VFGFLGPNGAGKTTTIRMILGLIKADSGSAEINGYDTKKDFLKAISSVGAVIKTPEFYSYLSAYQNLALIRNLHPNVPKKRIGEILDIVGLADRAADKVDTYSLGMKQRLGIARALLNYPKLVILDEPTNGLDPQGIKEVREMILQLALEQDITFFISSHLLTRGRLLLAKVMSLIIMITLLLIFPALAGYVLGTIMFGWGAGFNYEVNLYSTYEGVWITLGSHMSSILPLTVQHFYLCSLKAVVLQCI
jgi:ABC-type multidrug transport system ATPase subunit